ncbi:hypothetical protein Dsin_024480 [Dipteronia sinensis]|uniref:Reverse transcriptase zinc-binding domain-containing protein n=1 Tax=Dipteronia sinensis TaxID=43782 RepID=A0AAE0DVY5_9ROSI|nr:hypothetical protein Dsin_024480 [Dipteronia sinensis]
MMDSITIDQFHPIVLGNFFFKVSSKILANRLAQIAARIVSPQQFGFIRDRHVEDCIALASDCVNVLHKKCYGGNVAMKIHIYDVLIFCRGMVRNLRKVVHAFRVYGSISGQLVYWNWSAFIFLPGGSSFPRSSLVERFFTLKAHLEVYNFEQFCFHFFVLEDGRWILDDRFRARFPDLCFRIGRIAISPVTDYLVWPHSREGSVSCKAAYSRMFHDIPQVPWWRDILSRYIPLSHSVLSWRLLLDRLPIEDRLCRAALSLVWHSVYDANHLGIGCMRNCVDDLLILRWFGLSGRPSKAPVIRSVVWSPPAPGWIKVNTYGAVLGSPGVGGCGGVFRTYRYFVKACFAVPFGQVFAFEAELLAASLAINYAWNLDLKKAELPSLELVGGAAMISGPRFATDTLNLGKPLKSTAQNTAVGAFASAVVYTA